MTRTNACKGREAGCTGSPSEGATRCNNCRRAHNQREATRRAARRAQCQCWVCGADALVVGGIYQPTCAAHVHYRRDVSA